MQAHNIGIQIKRKELTKAFMMISNWKRNLPSECFIKKIFQRLKGWMNIGRVLCSLGPRWYFPAPLDHVTIDERAEMPESERNQLIPEGVPRNDHKVARNSDVKPHQSESQWQDRPVYSELSRHKYVQIFIIRDTVIIKEHLDGCKKV